MAYSIDELSKMLAPQLRELAAQSNISDYKKLKKQELLDALVGKSSPHPPKPKTEPSAEPKTEPKAPISEPKPAP